MTRPLYHESTELTFTSIVEELQGHEIRLAASAFYPESGGQASDQGTLQWAEGTAQLLHTRKEKTTGHIWHQVSSDQALPQIGAQVTGQVDPSLRWKHSQRHSAEHLLAQAFKRVNPAFEVASVSMLGPECSIDFAGDPTPVHIQEAETLLRETLGRQELTLETPQVSESELEQYPLRRESKMHGTVRLVIFKGANGEYFDVSACGGTHVPRAAMCGPIVILRSERIKGNLTRVTFMAGEEAGAYLNDVYQQSRALAQTFSASVDQLPARIQTLQNDHKKAHLQQEQLRRQLAKQLIIQQPSTVVSDIPVLQFMLDDLALLSPMLIAVPEGHVIVAAHQDGRCGIGSHHPKINAGGLLRAVFSQIGGKGGGKPDLAQGTTEQVDQFIGAVLTQLTKGTPSQ